MYGTVARLRIKPGAEAQLAELAREFDTVQVPGFVAQYGYRTDADPQEYYLVVIFESKEAYLANASSPEQHSRYEQYSQLLTAEPEWHDGEVAFAFPRPA